MNCHCELAACLPRFEQSQRRRLVRRSRLGVSHPASKPASAMLGVLSAMASVNRRSENLQHRGAHSKAHKTWGRSISSISVCRTALDLLVPGVAPEPGFHGGHDHPGSMCVVGGHAGS